MTDQQDLRQPNALPEVETTSSDGTGPKKHSPLPWRVAYEGEPEIKDANSQRIASIYSLGDDGSPTFPETEANAELIVSSVNERAIRDAIAVEAVKLAKYCSDECCLWCYELRHDSLCPVGRILELAAELGIPHP